MQNYRKTIRYRLKLSESLMGHKVSKETRIKISKANKGNSPPNKGKTAIDIYGDRTEEYLAENSRRTWIHENLPEVKEKKSRDHMKYYIPEDILQELYVEQKMTTAEIRDLLGIPTVWDWLKRYNIPRRKTAEYLRGRKVTWGDKIADAERGKIVSDTTKELISKQMKEKIKNPEYRRELYRRLNKRPNKFESKLSLLINEACPDEYKYTGNGSFTIDYKYHPDFTNANSKKKVIEGYGRYWHTEKEAEERINIFAGYGFETLIIWEDELKNPEKVVQKVKDFTFNKVR